MERKKKRQSFAKPVITYGWSSITQIEKGTTIVVNGQDVKVVTIVEKIDEWWLGYIDPETGKKVEELYQITDFIYIKL